MLPLRWALALDAHGRRPRRDWRTGHRRWPRRWTPTTPLHSAPGRHPGATDAEACSLASWTSPLRFLARPKSVDRPLSALYPGAGAIRRPGPSVGRVAT